MILNDPDPLVCIRAADAEDAKDRAHVLRGGSICCLCGVRLAGREGLCPHHGND